MRSRGTLLMVAIALVAAGCTTSTPGYVAPTPQLSVDPDAPCPRSLGGAKDVENPAHGLTRRLVPKDVPSGGLVCVYRPPATVQTVSDAPRLIRQVRMTATDAAAMTRDLPLVSLDPIRRTYSCPGGPGRIIIVGFTYAGRGPVSLWFADRGCPTLDNGHVIANGVDHPSFHDHFTTRLDAQLSDR